MNFIKLLNFEWNRFLKILVVLLLLVMALQSIGTILISNDYMNKINDVKEFSGVTNEQAIEIHGLFSFNDIVRSSWFYGPIFIGIASVLFYIFFIWYRDWLGKNTFIYRLLMLPTERINLYLSKLVTILMITLSLVAAQLITLLIDIQIMNWLVPDPFLIDLSVQEILRSNLDTGMLYPRTFTEFVLYYGAGITIVSVIFTSILLERCFRAKGIVLGVIYAFCALFLFIGPFVVGTTFWREHIFPEEYVWLMILTGILTLSLSVGFSAYLLRNKIRV